MILQQSSPGDALPSVIEAPDTLVIGAQQLDAQIEVFPTPVGLSVIRWAFRQPSGELISLMRRQMQRFQLEEFSSRALQDARLRLTGCSMTDLSLMNGWLTVECLGQLQVQPASA